MKFSTSNTKLSTLRPTFWPQYQSVIETLTSVDVYIELTCC